MFTFLTITYNHEKYIIEHLETIKFQIKNFAKKERIELIISDDNSTDQTISLIKKWVNYNAGLFEKIQILTSEKNQGIVKNYLRGLNAITSDSFKVLAGDDLYFNNNVFNVIGQNDIVFSSPIVFSQNGICSSTTMKVMFNCSKVKNKSLLQMSKDIKKGNIYINVPSAFYDVKIAKDKHMQEYISKYTWIEDYPLWYYLFAINDKKLNFKYLEEPYVLYRFDSGISHKGQNKKYDKFIEEQKTMKKDMGIKKLDLPKYINPHEYVTKLYLLKKQYIDSVFKNEGKKTYNKYEESIRVAEEYLHIIRKSAKFFYKQVGEE